MPFQEFFNHRLMDCVPNLRFIPKRVIENDQHFWNCMKGCHHIVQKFRIWRILIFLHRPLQVSRFFQGKIMNPQVNETPGQRHRPFHRNRNIRILCPQFHGCKNFIMISKGDVRMQPQFGNLSVLYVEGLAGRKWRSPVAAIEVQFYAVDAFVAFDLLLDNVADARNSVRDARDEPKQFMRMERMSVQ